jgi:hypothetical protein
MTNTDELERLAGPDSGNVPSVAQALIPYRVRTVKDSQGILNRAKEVLEAVLRQDPEAWPTAEQWRDILPTWFVEASSDDISEDEAKRVLELPMEERLKFANQWSVEAFTYWFLPSERYWHWWSAMVVDNQTIVVTLAVDDLPFPSGSFVWLFLASGAASVEEI